MKIITTLAVMAFAGLYVYAGLEWIAWMKGWSTSKHSTLPPEGSQPIVLTDRG